MVTVKRIPISPTFSSSHLSSLLSDPSVLFSIISDPSVLSPSTLGIPQHCLDYIFQEMTHPSVLPLHSHLMLSHHSLAVYSPLSLSLWCMPTSLFCLISQFSCL